MSSFLFSDRSIRSVKSGCSGTRVATCPVRLSPIRADHSYSLQGKRERSLADTNSSLLAGEVLAGGDISVALRPVVAAAHTQGSVVAGVQGDLPPSPGAHGYVGLARERLNLAASGLPSNVIATIQGVRVRSTRDAYDGKCRTFEEWCVKAGVVAFQSSVAVILTFLQQLLDKVLALADS